ncbi:MAG: tRNA (cytidine(34)-2'-O)-methyltransferase [Clostridiales bacterium]|jgi:tRNA (cytidine/uridine-2'-O-)-methyltransferase|nr:tRNA (cytidine(34)-2'-O)-methyltransferase [Clostridiales bacterium]
MNIVLLEPEIPHNTGAIGRTCVATGSVLHLIKPLGFLVTEKAIRRTGLDYWADLDVRYYDNFEHFISKNSGEMFFATTKALHNYSDVKYNTDSYIIFGKESAGLPEELLVKNKDRCIRIPMLENTRSLNLSVSAGIILFEALRQNSFVGLKEKGELHKGQW